MNKQALAKDCLQELWTIKDETAARFPSAAAYFEHLGLPKPRAPQLTQVQPQKTTRRRLSGTVQAH